MEGKRTNFQTNPTHLLRVLPLSGLPLMSHPPKQATNPAHTAAPHGKPLPPTLWKAGDWLRGGWGFKPAYSWHGPCCVVFTRVCICPRIPRVETECGEYNTARIGNILRITDTEPLTARSPW